MVMSHPGVSSVEADNKFKWGRKKGVGKTNKDFHFYESFSYNGVEYFLYDSVYFYIDGQNETSIGKLVKMFETPSHEKKVKVVWFFRPADIRNFLGDFEPRWNEIFLACGVGNGLSNCNTFDTIIGKCNVVCTSTDRRNPPASEEELRMADYVFSRAFDVRKHIILEKFEDEIDGIKVEFFFNRGNNRKLKASHNIKKALKGNAGKSSLSSKLGQQVAGIAVDKGKSVQEVNPWVKGTESGKPIASMHDTEALSHETPNLQPKAVVENNGTQCCTISPKPRMRTSNSSTTPSETQPYKKLMVLSDSHSSISQESEHVKREDSEKDRRSWFKQLPWEQRLQRAQEVGALVLLDNLDPSFSSSEVEDLILNALNQKVEAKMIQHNTFSNPHYGKAFVIFNSKVAAETAIYKLTQRCLILSEGRPLAACRGTLTEYNKQANFYGHLGLHKLTVQRQSEEMKNAVSTSHCSQPNTIEYDMAVEWRVLQEKSDLWWKALHEKQMKEIHMICVKRNCSS